MSRSIVLLSLTILAIASGISVVSANDPPPLTIAWQDNFLTIRGEHLPGKEIKVLYLEAYCRADSHSTDWVAHTVIPHKTELVSANDAGTEIHLRCTVADGLIVDHVITAGDDEIDFHITAKNPTDKRSEAHWAQPCIRVGAFTGLGDPENPRTYEYLKKSFVFLDGKLETMPTRDWATEARYVPGQEWAGPGVPRKDVNPRPLNPHVPSCGLIGCFGKDDKYLLAVAFDPYQELFQGVITCLHSDFRLGGLQPGEEKVIRGKLYLMKNDVPKLLERYHHDFPDAKQKHETNTP